MSFHVYPPVDGLLKRSGVWVPPWTIFRDVPSAEVVSTSHSSCWSCGPEEPAELTPRFPVRRWEMRRLHRDGFVTFENPLLAFAIADARVGVTVLAFVVGVVAHGFDS